MGKLGFLCFGEVGGKGIYFIGVLEGLREMEMRKKGCKVARPFGTLKEKTGGYGFKAVIGRM